MVGMMRVGLRVGCRSLRIGGDARPSPPRISRVKRVGPCVPSGRLSPPVTPLALRKMIGLRASATESVAACFPLDARRSAPLGRGALGTPGSGFLTPLVPIRAAGENKLSPHCFAVVRLTYVRPRSGVSLSLLAHALPRL